MPKRWYIFIIIVSTTIIIKYLLPKEFIILWTVIVLVLYYKSKDEPLWLAIFLVTTDGFAGFMGLYAITLPIVPGLPSIELVQLYFLLSIVKALRIKVQTYVFYNKYLLILLLYLIVMIIWGQINGFEGKLNVYFRVAKMVMPMLLFFTIPRLFPTLKEYTRLFSFIFMIIIIAFASQLITLTTGYSPSAPVTLSGEEMIEAGKYRGFYNVAATLLGLFGALFYLTNKKNETFHYTYLYVVIAFAFGMAYFSASRGWTLFIGSVIFISCFVIYKISLKRIVGLVAVFALAIYISMENPFLKKQSEFSNKRLETMNLLLSGDMTAGQTLARISIRSPRVMKKWSEKPVFGWGFSDTFIKYQDGHVGNQNILLFSGIIGFMLLIGFLINYCLKIGLRSSKAMRKLKIGKSYSIFIVFIAGWFFLHSSGAQQFGYYGLPIQIIPQAIIFSFGALLYSKPSELIN